MSETTQRYGSPLYAFHDPAFAEEGVYILVSRYDRCERCQRNAAFDYVLRAKEKLPEDVVMLDEPMSMMATEPIDEHSRCQHCVEPKRRML